mgnify:CR=1 FL=1
MILRETQLMRTMILRKNMESISQIIEHNIRHKLKQIIKQMIWVKASIERTMLQMMSKTL